MLVLSRKEGESIVIGDGDLRIMVLEVRGNKVRLGIEAHQGVKIHRQEIWEEIHRRPYSRPANQEGPGSQAPDGASPHRASA